jgi:glycosyltransferase involved in cell wall biosynthesis
VKVSLVVPVKNEADSIECLMSSVAGQTRRPNEMIVVDGGSADGAPEIIEKWLSRRSLSDWARVVRVEEATPGKGRNIGVAEARYDWIAFTDAGIRLEQSWLERLIEVAERDDQIDVVYGNYEPVAETFFERCSALAYPAPKTIREGRLMRGPFIASSLIRRHVWEAVGGFPDLRAAEDLIFMNRVAEAGFKTGWASDATVWWQLRPDLSTVFRKFALYSTHNVRAGMQRYWHYGVARQYLIGLLFVALAVIYNWWWLSIPVLGYAARVAKSIWIRRERRGLLWAINPAQFAMVAAILLTIDAATFAGWRRAIRERGGRRTGQNG